MAAETTTAAEAPKMYGMLARFDGPAELTHACEKLRDAGYRDFDAHTPFPVHGLERAMGLRPSRLPWISLVGGILGGTGAFALQTWVHIWGYPLNYSGKPHFAVPTYIPITFELTVLFCAFATFFAMWGMNGLPRLFHPVMQHPQFHRATDDGFFVSVESTDPNYDADKIRALLTAAGGKDVAEVQA